MNIKSPNAITSKRLAKTVSDILAKKEKGENKKEKVDLGKLATELANRKLEADAKGDSEQ